MGSQYVGDPSPVSVSYCHPIGGWRLPRFCARIPPVRGVLPLDFDNKAPYTRVETDKMNHFDRRSPK